MRQVRAWWCGLLDAAHALHPGGTPLSVARTLLAIATMTVVALTPDSALFAYTAQFPSGMNCNGLRGTSLWCVNGTTGHGLLLSRVLALAVLTVTAAGYRPRWTCVPHWYVTFGLATSMTLPNGGEMAGQILALLLIPMCLGDDRRWQWRRGDCALPPTWQGASWAALLAVRGQAAIIYGDAAVSKLTSPGWRNGTAMYFVFHDPGYGMPPALLRLTEPMVDSAWFIAPLTWAVIATETSIALLVLGNRKMRFAAVLLAGALHGAIALTMGLFSFGLVMVALLLVSYVGAPHRVGPDPGLAERVDLGWLLWPPRSRRARRVLRAEREQSAGIGPSGSDSTGRRCGFAPPADRSPSTLLTEFSSRDSGK